MLRAKRKDAIRRKATEFFRARYEQVVVRPKQGLFNHKCFWNAVEFAGKQKIRCDVYECVAIDDGWPALHYVVMKNGEYLEVTLGHRAENIEYYVLRRVPRSDWSRIGDEFPRSLQSWTLQFTTWFDRHIMQITRAL